MAGSLDYRMTLDETDMIRGAASAQNAIHTTTRTANSLGRSATAVSQAFSATSGAMAMVGVQAAPQMANAVTAATGTMIALKSASIATGASLATVAAGLVGAGAALAILTSAWDAWKAHRSEGKAEADATEGLQKMATSRISELKGVMKTGNMAEDLGNSLIKDLQDALVKKTPEALSQALQTSYRHLVRMNISDAQKGQREVFTELMRGWMIDSIKNPAEKATAEINHWAGQQKQKLEESLNGAGFTPEELEQRLTDGYRLINDARLQRISEIPKTDNSLDTGGRLPRFSEIERMGFSMGGSSRVDSSLDRVARATEETARYTRSIAEKQGDVSQADFRNL